MDYSRYDRLQASLGGISCEYKSACERILRDSPLDEQEKAVLDALCAKTSDAIDELAKSICDTLIAAAK